MSIRTSEEEKFLSEKRNERKQAIEKFKSDYISSFVIGFKIGGVGLVLVIIVYLVAKLLFNWDLFYETDLEYTDIVLALVVVFLFVIGLSCLVAFILYNTKHSRNTKYKGVNEGVRK